MIIRNYFKRKAINIENIIDTAKQAIENVTPGGTDADSTARPIVTVQQLITEGALPTDLMSLMPAGGSIANNLPTMIAAYNLANPSKPIDLDNILKGRKLV